MQVHGSERGQRIDDPLDDGRRQQAADRGQCPGVGRGDDHPPSVVHQCRDGGRDLGGVDVVQDQQRVLADRRDQRAGLVRGAARGWGERAGTDGFQARGQAAQARHRDAGGDGAPDLLVGACRRAVRSGRTEAVDEGQKALVIARVRSDLQHSVTSARSDTARASVTVRIAGYVEMLHASLRILNGAAPRGHSLRRPDRSIDTPSPFLSKFDRPGVTAQSIRVFRRRRTARTGR